MKKLVSLLLVVCMCLSISVMLTACGHEHTYQTEWSKDATHHWHACEGENCTDIADKAEHTWNDGEITTQATADADGVKTFTCTACGQTKTADVPYVVLTPTQSEWTAAFNATVNAENLTFSREQLVNQSSDGVQTVHKDNEKIFMEYSHPYNTVQNCYFYKADNTIYHYTNSTGNAWEREETNSIIHIPALSDIMMPFEALYSSFSFDTQTKMFILDEAKVLGFEMANIEIKIENGHITYFTYTMVKDSSADIDSNYTLIFHFSEYGTTAVTLPTVVE